MKQALYYKKYEGNKVRCQLCPRKCLIEEGSRGNCRVRENKEGILYSKVYGKLCSIAIDPIEKKPLFHFLPGTSSYSIGTAGCNLHCVWCQNWSTSQKNPEDVFNYNLEPKEVVKRAVESKCKSISYTYNEPTIFFEYVLETAKLARKKGLKNIMVTNGYINKEPALELYEYIDAANIDLKGFSEDIYRKYCSAELRPVLDAIFKIKEKKTFIEITNLIVPKVNDDLKLIKEMCIWIKTNVGENTPMHFSRFFPCYKMENSAPTPNETLIKAKEIAEKAGLKYVYIGNVQTPKSENTYCPKCKELLVKRTFFTVNQNNIKNSSCRFCKENIAGVWK